MSCGIYMWVSPSEKKYIGQSRNLEKRKKEFVTLKKIYTSKGSAIDNARQTYSDFSKWKYYVLEECEPNILNEREKYYIKEHDSFKNGYNSNEGGDFDSEAVTESAIRRSRNILQYDLNGNLIKRWASVSDASRVLNVSKSSLTSAATNQGKKTCLGYQWMWVPDNGKIKEKIKSVKCRSEKISESKHKKIIQYTISGDIVKEWCSIKEASETLGLSHSHISACCKGKRASVGGYQWRYFSDGGLFLEDIGDGKERIRKARKKVILQYSLNGDFIKEWDSITAAEKALRISGISYCINGKILTVGDFQWRKKICEEYPKKIDKVLPKHIRTGIGKRKKN